MISKLSLMSFAKSIDFDVHKGSAGVRSDNKIEHRIGFDEVIA